MVKTLDQILLSDEVKYNFQEAYKEDKFKNWIYSIMPEIEDCKNLAQDNPWHIYKCLDHILVAVEEINKQTKDFSEEERRMLAYTMFLHDIGKPECFIRRYSKLYGREVDSFFNHNKASVKIADRVLNEFGFKDGDRSKILALIDAHDIFMFVTLEDDGNKFHHVLTEDFLKDEIEKLNKFGDGEKLMKYLLLVGRADNMAQNPEMTKDSLVKIDVMEEMLSKLNNKFI